MSMPGSPLTTPDADDDEVVNYPILYPLGLLALFGIYLLLGLTVNHFELEITFGDSSARVEYLIWELGVIHFLFGIRIVDANQIGGIFLLGWMTAEVSGTVVCVPPGPFWLITLPLLTKEMEIPAEPENIWRGEGNPPAERPDLRPPVRITFAEGADKNDPLQRRVTEEVSFFVRLRIERFFPFYVRIGSIEEAKHQLEDAGVSYLAEVLPSHTLSDAIKKVADYSRELKERLDAAVGGWGVRIPTARVKQFPFSKSLNTSIQQMAESTAKKIATITTAEGEREKRSLEGAGTAAAEKAVLDARTDALTRRMKDLNITDGAVVAGIEAAERIGQGSSTKIIVGAPGIKELVGLGASIAEGTKTPTK